VGRDDQQYLIKKLWSHGQFFAPIQGLMILVWSFKEPLGGTEFIYCSVAFLLLGCWSYLSWRSMNKFWPSSPVLIGADLGLQCYYIGIIVVCARHLSNSTFSLMVLMFICLQVMETGAYLAMVGCLMDSLSIFQSEPLQDCGLDLPDRDRNGLEKESFL
jgi:hypothetical protein